MSFVMKIMVSLDIVSFATLIVNLLIWDVAFGRTEEFFEKVLRIMSFVYLGSLVGTGLTWIWGW